MFKELVRLYVFFGGVNCLDLVFVFWLVAVACRLLLLRPGGRLLRFSVSGFRAALSSLKPCIKVQQDHRGAPNP